MFQYRPIKQMLFSTELGDYCSYGIRAFSVTQSGSVAVQFVPDVSCDEAFVSLLAEKCTRQQLDPVQLLDVILDALP